MKVLITGIAGFIGSNLAERLLEYGEARKRQSGIQGIDVVGIDNLAYGVWEQIPAGVDFHQMDVRSREIYPLFENVDYVFHLAAKNCITDCQEDPVETADINVTGSVNVFEAARRAGVKKVIYAESSAMYEGSSVFPTPETEVRPESFYAVSKLASMYFAEAYRRFYVSQSSPPTSHKLTFTALRYFCVYGPRQDYRRSIPPVMSAFIIKLLKGEEPVIYGTGDKKRDFVYVDDVNAFHLLCMNDPRTDGNVYNLGSGVNYSVNDIYEMIRNLLEVNTAPKYEADLPGEAQITLADISAACALGWRPETNIRHGLEEMIQYIKREMTEGKIR
ncbi:MAG: NAD-dependent epimerase/dehydratase family protein [Deltaproteobacteria bacterium]|nr:NAD-dependent epimerase/dehydratase family protein [Deltaproteobacteria bacterium]